MGNEISQVYPNLYISGVLPARDARVLQDKGISHIVGILPKVRENHEFVTYHKIEGVPDNRQHADAFSEKFAAAFEFIHNALSDDKKVLVHCLKGSSRSATLIIAYLLVVTDLPLTTILTKIKAIHSKVNPNPGFMNLLENLDPAPHRAFLNINVPNQNSEKFLNF